MTIEIRAYSESEGMEYIDDFYWFEENGVHDLSEGGHFGKQYKFMLYSGIKDRHQKKIFDGDIANSCYGIGRVYRDERGFKFEFDTDTDDLWGMAVGIDGKKFEVIGNIHENPELLTG